MVAVPKIVFVVFVVVVLLFLSSSTFLYAQILGSLHLYSFLTTSTSQWFQLSGGMPRKSSTSIGPSTNSSSNATSVLVHKTTESHAFGSSYSPQYSLQTLVGASATPQQKIVQVLVNRLKNKVLQQSPGYLITQIELFFFQLPCNSGVPLDRVESDIPTQRAIESLVELSVDSLDMIAWTLSELLDRLAKVSTLNQTKKNLMEHPPANRSAYWSHYYRGPSIAASYFESALHYNVFTLDSTFLLRFLSR